MNIILCPAAIFTPNLRTYMIMQQNLNQSQPLYEHSEVTLLQALVQYLGFQSIQILVKLLCLISCICSISGVNPFQNDHVIYTMWLIYNITILHLPRDVHQLFSNLMLVGIVPGSCVWCEQQSKSLISSRVMYSCVIPANFCKFGCFIHASTTSD